MAVASKVTRQPSITSEQFAGLMASCAPFESTPTLAIALSGGSDSMALTLLAHEWVKERGGTIIALTVDHGLRNESRQEAETVGGWCQKLGIEHCILTWATPIHLSSVQENAREARYKLLTDFCKQRHILHLLSAHQLQDQGETFLFRLARGSGLSGLACMPMVSEISGVRLLRPLLSVSKESLRSTLEAHNHPWVEDPSNQKPVYTRNRIRQFLSESDNQQMYNSRMSILVYNFGKIRNILKIKEASYITNSILMHSEGYALLRHDAFLAIPEETALHVLSALVMTLSGTKDIPRSEKLERLYQCLITSTDTKRSFGGLLFSYNAKQNGWLLAREPNARQEAIALPASTAILWDDRFLVQWQGDEAAVSVRALEREVPKSFKNNRALPKIVLASLPSFWHLEKMIAVPHISYVHNDYQHFRFSARFTPAKPLAGRAFFSSNNSPM